MTHSPRILMTADPIGGVWTYCLDLAAALTRYNVEIALATMGARPSTAQLAEIARLPNVEIFTSDYKLEWMDDAWSEVDEAGDWLLHVAREFGPDVIHLNGYVHAGLNWEAPVLVVAHSCVLSWWDAVNDEFAPGQWAEYGHRVGRGLRQADLVIAPTSSMLTNLGEHYAFATPRRVIPNCRQPHLFAPAAKKPVIFSAGRLWDEAKNVAVLERIAPSLQWPVHLAGAARIAGHSAPGIEKGSAVLLGELPTSDLARRLAAASIYAAPARYEPFGLGILEAALSGCALVLSDLPSLRENWQEAAVFVPPNDDAAWIRALNGLASDPERRGWLAASARLRGLQFAPAKTAEAYFEAYQELRAARQPLLLKIA